MTDKTALLQNLNEAENNRLRKAYRDGQKTVTLNGVKMTIAKMTREVKYWAAGEMRSRKESWLVAKPADGSLTPHIQIEIKKGDNIRSDV